VRIGLGQDGAGKLTSQDCLNLGRELFKIDCGFAFTRFVTSPERRKSLDLKEVPTTDIIAGLATAAHAAKYTGERYGTERTNLQKRLKSVASAANRIANKVRKSGLKAYGGKELDDLVADVEKSTKKHLDSLRKVSKDACGQPLAAPKIKGRAS
jgi:hypothetical protein